MEMEQINSVASTHGKAFHLPPFERDAGAIGRAVDEAILRADAAMDSLAAIPDSDRNFENTGQFFDHLWCDAMEVANRIYLLKEVDTSEEIREAADKAIKKFQQWAVGIDYREDVYAAFKSLAESNPKISGEQKLYLSDVMRDYRRSGMDLEPDKRHEIESLRVQLSDLETDFRGHITKAQKSLSFSAEELAGVPDSFLNSPGVKQEDGSLEVKPNITWHAMVIFDHADNEETRKTFLDARLSLCKDENAPILDEIIQLRQKIAEKLGYKSWAHYRTEVRMAGTPDRALDFLHQLKSGLRDKFLKELELYRQLKVKATGDTSAEIHLHDYRYFQNHYQKEAFSVDKEALRHFFPYQKVLEGMFTIFGDLFGLDIEPFEPDFKWVEDLEAYLVKDRESGSPLGALYLDMFPREGKFNHFAQFGLIPGRMHPDKTYQCPVVALICNFALPEEGKPSLLTHNEVETLFHEFGHALHSILTKAETNRYSGTGVDHDFVEVPSQMLEFWAWDKKTLDRFARDHRDPEKTIPLEVLEKMKEADKAVKGTHYTRQVGFSLVDLTLHRERSMDEPVNAVEEANQILNEVFLPHPEGSAFAAYFGHLCGYDAGYYSYAWADAIAADLNTVFKNSPAGYQDGAQGKRLRELIYQPGGSVDPNKLVEEFLGRPTSINPFIESIGATSSK